MQKEKVNKWVIKPWGRYKIIDGNHLLGYKVKIIEILSHARTSLQYHKYRSERITVLSGELLLELYEPHREWARVHRLKPYSLIEINKRHIHRLTNEKYKRLCLLELQYGIKCIERDIKRLEDDYNRV